ncbi:MFS transporter [Microbacterium sp. NC79]|uniref:MFS transporter n=1 Tax=Microbacterium sp. NC79 TaxID=2851009 RepID=UPI001C2CAABD|nr:MFS transporter [Microbacterium sp. NC79]MBV0894569.1 MFS transporter [Microbacterium sp. NC79]
MIYGPTILFALGEGAVIPLLPVLATKMGADLAASSLVVTALVIGQLCGNLPAGWAVGRFGERLTMIASSLVTLAGTLVLMLAPSVGMLMLSALIIGFSASAFGLARHAFMTTRVPLHFRARALSLLGGSFRFGMFIGPFATAALLSLFGTEYASIWFFIACTLAVIALVTFGPDPEKVAAASAPEPRVVKEQPADDADTGELISTGSIPTVAAHEGIFRTMLTHRAVLFRLGLTAASLSGLRSARQALLPLWGVSLGLDAQSIALIVGISGAIDFALFYASGQVMDRFGRLWAALPATVLMAAGFLALSLTHDLSEATMWFGAFAMMLGVGNGLSSGILLTLGADTAPQHDPAPYLGSWRMMTDGGATVAPLLITAITAAASLPFAAAAMGVLGIFGSIGFARYIPRFVPRPEGRE